ncbi:hypothetical protein KKC45_03895 [Patescibacteria group bacterium]|nr:hypothetical protein [Patescibacteria group bacterium]
MEEKNNKKEIEVEILPNDEIDSSLEKKDDLEPIDSILDTDAPGSTIDINDDDIIDGLEISPVIKQTKENLTTENISEKKDNVLKKSFIINPEPKTEEQAEAPKLSTEKISPEKKEEPKKTTPIISIKKESEKIPSEKIKEEEIKNPFPTKEAPQTETKTNPVQKENFLNTINQEKKSLTKTVRTYQDDVVKTMKEQKTSLTKMVIAEQKKNDSSTKKTKKTGLLKNKKIISIIIIVPIVIVSALAGFYFLSEKEPEGPIVVTELQIPTFIFPNYTREIFLTRLTRNKIIEALESEKESISIQLGSIIQLFLTKEDQTKQYVIKEVDGNKLLITTEVFFDTIGAKAPATLTRSLSSDFMFGYHSSLGNNPFLVFKVKSYSNAFSGMLEWEKTILKDLSPIFIKEGSIIDLESKEFQDIILINKDVRAILNSSGKIEFAYAFPNKETLVIINNETTFQELSRRIINANLERKD